MQSSPATQRRILILTIVLVALRVQNVDSVELSEFKHTLKIVHDVCQTTTKVPEDMIQQVRNDNYVDNPDIKCYAHCVLEMVHLMEGTVGQFHVAAGHTEYMIPDELFQTTIKAFGHCEGLTNGMTDNCEAAYAMLKCFREGNKGFWLP